MGLTKALICLVLTHVLSAPVDLIESVTRESVLQSLGRAASMIAWKAAENIPHRCFRHAQAEGGFFFDPQQQTYWTLNNQTAIPLDLSVGACPFELESAVVPELHPLCPEFCRQMAEALHEYKLGSDPNLTEEDLHSGKSICRLCLRKHIEERSSQLLGSAKNDSAIFQLFQVRLSFSPRLLLSPLSLTHSNRTVPPLISSTICCIDTISSNLCNVLFDRLTPFVSSRIVIIFAARPSTFSASSRIKSINLIRSVK